jgi:acyl-ACP thioesterase
MTELVPRPIRGRQYSHDRQVRLSDAGPDGVLRLDGAARYLQDAASDDWAASGLDNKELWVVRHTVICVAEGGRWPELGEKITVTTWCSGIGPAWAERRTDFEADDGLLVRAVALWVSLDPSGRPLRLKQAFQDIYGEAAGGRRVSGRVAAAPTHVAAPTRPWHIRRADLDVVGHVNNAAVWAAVTEVAIGTVSSAALTHHGPVESGRTTKLATEPGRLWIISGGEVKVSAEFAMA